MGASEAEGVVVRQARPRLPLGSLVCHGISAARHDLTYEPLRIGPTKKFFLGGVTPFSCTRFLSLELGGRTHGSHVLLCCSCFVRFSFRVQQKNTCAHNNTQKAHANGIKKAKRTKHVSTKGMDPKFLRNQKFAKKYNKSKRNKNDE
jgi:large subunit ribosomal protein L29e